MIELFAIFSKGGLVLWCINESKDFFREAVNDLIGNVILQVTSFFSFFFSFSLFQQRNLPVFKTDSMSLKYKMDNEFDLVFLVCPFFIPSLYSLAHLQVVFQSVIQMSYADKLLTEVNLRFRDMYKNVLGTEAVFRTGPRLFKAFDQEFPKCIHFPPSSFYFSRFRILGRLRDEQLNAEPKKPRTYQVSTSFCFLFFHSVVFRSRRNRSGRSRR